MPARKRLTHLDASNHVQMVDVGDKAVTDRSASAQAIVTLPAACRAVLAAGGATRKGNVFEVARLAGIMAAKRTSELIPLCHQIPLAGVSVELRLNGKRLLCEAGGCSGRPKPAHVGVRKIV